MQEMIYCTNNGGNMVQRHSIILWKKAEKMDKGFEEISNEAYMVLDLFQDMPCELRPNYLTANTMKNIKEFDWNFENFTNILRTGVNKEGKNTFERLGYSISFFSSFDEEKSCTFSLSAGNKSERIYNALIIDLPLAFNLYDKANAELIISLFRKLARLYIPYWGCVSNRELARKYGKFLEGSRPTTVHWMNYWSEEIVRAVGIDRIQGLIQGNQGISFDDDILLIKNTAFDLSIEEDIRLHEKIHNQIFL